uniref:Uncharacterized protein n=1 Tax=Knipowitschia caucasica TaxID=637954 RepID=A0AAV2L8M0_KNICA
MLARSLHLEGEAVFWQGEMRMRAVRKNSLSQTRILRQSGSHLGLQAAESPPLTLLLARQAEPPPEKIVDQGKQPHPGTLLLIEQCHCQCHICQFSWCEEEKSYKE